MNNHGWEGVWRKASRNAQEVGWKVWMEGECQATTCTLVVCLFFFFFKSHFLFCCSISSSEPPGIISEYHPLPHFRKQCFKLYHSNHLLLLFKIIKVFLILGILSGMKLGRHLLNAIWISDIMLSLEKRKCFIVPALVALCHLI